MVLNLRRLKFELANDPLTRGYAGMTDAQAAADLNTAYRNQDTTTVTGGQIYALVPESAYQALTNSQKDEFLRICQIPEHDPFGLVADRIISLFGSGSDAVQALASLRRASVSRAFELLLVPTASAQLSEQAVTDARAL